MKIFKVFGAILFLLLTASPSFAQELQLPQNVELKTPEDYKNTESDVLQSINWLENTSLNEHPEKRKAANAFVMQWISGTPSFSVGLMGFQMKLVEKNPQLLMSFMGGWTRFVLENPSEKDNTIAANVAGIESLIKVYKANLDQGLKKDRKVEKLASLDHDELENWVRTELK